jgi:hypothetical protein
MQAKLNSFQRTMFQWDDLHPYLAVHVARLEGAPDYDRLQGVLDTTLEAAGLTGLEIDRRVDGGPADLALEAEAERQLNTRFDTAGGRFSPFRFFVVVESGGFHLGLVYFHVVADGHSITLLMRDIIERYRGTVVEPRARRGPERSTLGLAKSFAPFLQRVVSWPGFVRNLRRSARPHYREPLNTEVGVRLAAPGADLLARWLEAARRWEVTLQDLLLALLLKGFAPLSVDRAGSRRALLSLGTIVDLRRDLGIADPFVFGLLLGSFVITHATPPQIPLRQLSREVSAQTRLIKKQRSYMVGSFDLALGRRVSTLNSAIGRVRFYQRYYPLWGGITNLNLNPFLGALDGAGRLDYLRLASVGPVTPFVLSLTTLEGRMQVGVTYRKAVFTRGEVDGVLALVLGGLDRAGVEP